MPGFNLSARSLQRLDGVHPRLVEIVKLAIQRTAVDFTVVEGVRTAERQRELVAQGASQTQNSLHLKQQDGFGHAVDLAPLVGGTIPWANWEAFIAVADAMRSASLQVGVSIRWGGSWTLLSELPKTITRSILHKTFPDGPHYEIKGLR
ncbi:M15 family metallopeptidase [Achromobacter sp. DH1f]|uniref:M15 family metallopeptidase n=1 Tax=Achromobacter sp. DH1f TaxID=1397275 RepID=UPI000469B40A|nr:M15 family metallopeptidase [Achromobacter sp. DH1f]